ncbi:hypothetical protein GE09DRAFT_62999 [Coniochaeta sp. 2T2.1]|nr:hypothetical protein GE09DRAFT_62999 [Coniochaeta sp. 2T2.1]
MCTKGEGKWRRGHFTGPCVSVSGPTTAADEWRFFQPLVPWAVCLLCPLPTSIEPRQRSQPLLLPRAGQGDHRLLESRFDVSQILGSCRASFFPNFNLSLLSLDVGVACVYCISLSVRLTSLAIAACPFSVPSLTTSYFFCCWKYLRGLCAHTSLLCLEIPGQPGDHTHTPNTRSHIRPSSPVSLAIATASLAIRVPHPSLFSPF